MVSSVDAHAAADEAPLAIAAGRWRGPTAGRVARCRPVRRCPFSTWRTARRASRAGASSPAGRTIHLHAIRDRSDSSRPTSRRIAQPVNDYRPLVQAAGLSVEAYEETPGWKERLLGDLMRSSCRT